MIKNFEFGFPVMHVFYKVKYWYIKYWYIREPHPCPPQIRCPLSLIRIVENLKWHIEEDIIHKFCKILAQNIKILCNNLICSQYLDSQLWCYKLQFFATTSWKCSHRAVVAPLLLHDAATATQNAFRTNFVWQPCCSHSDTVWITPFDTKKSQQQPHYVNNLHQSV